METHPSPLEEFRDSYLGDIARSHDLQIEWMLPTRLPNVSAERYRRTENPEGISLGPPAGRHGMTHPGS